ncbi:MAG TPA: Hsp70 family protein [Deltaproteobacteria bacterium]|nr:Hsp70 family protein [Deltaproteobacteria bacterium]
MARAVGIDFGTTNSAVSVVRDGERPALARFRTRKGETPVFRSILYFDPERREGNGRLLPAAGPEAMELYRESGGAGRLMQSLKSFLGSRLFLSTNVYGTNLSLETLIGYLLSALRVGAEADLGDLGTRAVVGRPVRFVHARSDEDERLALARLRAAFRAAGFAQIEFEYEPVAAAYHYELGLDHDELVLIGDLGGGTSDFCLLRVGPRVRREGRTRVLGTDGVALAGDAFDGRVVRNLLAPRLGLGAEFRSIFGRVLPVPSWIYRHLERWHHFSQLRTPETLHLLHALRKECVEPGALDGLLHLVDHDLGFPLYRAIEAVKLALSQDPLARFAFSDGPIEIEEPLARVDFEQWIAQELGAIEDSVARLLGHCGVGAGEVDCVFLTGGSSLVPAVRHLFERRFGKERLRAGAELTSVASGLALRALE